MKIKIKIARSVFEWLFYDAFPNMEMMATARTKIHPHNEVEFWVNVIVQHVLLQLCKKFSKKENTGSKTVAFDLEIAEALTLYRFLQNYPDAGNHWIRFQIDKLTAELHQQLTSFQTVNTIFTEKSHATVFESEKFAFDP